MDVYLAISTVWAHLPLADAPVLDASYVAQVFSRALHILAAIILLGGLFYIRTVLAPAGDQACFAGRRAIWARWAGIASGLLLVTGIYNFLTINNQVKADGNTLERAYHMMFGVKFLLALLLMFLAAVLAGKTDLAERFRSQMGKWLNISWVVGLAIVIIAALLRTLH
ncbi:MAG: hypothetical protein MK171_09020 [Pirellulales bacterium]|nr:hypothetical protein [Pirellulales bacterium]